MNRVSSLTHSAVLVCLLFAAPATAQIVRYPDPALHYVYPAGGRQGDRVEVELGGLNGLTGAKGVLVEGPPGVTVRDVKPISAAEVRATFEIASDAVPGRRTVRVVGAANGLTCLRYFFVSRLPEVIEKEPNNTPEQPQDVAVPAVVNGRLSPARDVDCYRFTAKAGRKLVAAIHGHGMDSRMRNSGGHGGFLDTSLELLDERGRIVAAAEDTLGLDPLLEYTPPSDGRFTVRVVALAHGGSRGAVYRLTLGDVAYPTWVFPAGGQIGRKTSVEFGGPNMPGNSRSEVETTSPFPWQTVRLDHAADDGRELPFVWGTHPEAIEKEPNDDAARAELLRLPMTINGRFDRAGDVDCYRVALKKGEGVVLEVTAQRHLRSPVDTVVEVLDSSGKILAENDDGQFFAGQCEHDFPSADSWLSFTAPADGEYLVRLRDQNGVSGPSAIYRLTVEALRPDYRLHQWPDAVPIWGPGTTASFVVQVQRWGGLQGDIALHIEGLPAGWTGSIGNLPASNYHAPNAGLNQKALMTITAPKDAAIGTLAPFRVIGRAEVDGKVLEREAMAQTLYGSSHTDRMHLRYSGQARAVVADYLDSWLETSVKELVVPQNGKVEVTAKLFRRPDTKGDLSISIDGETVGAGSGWRTPLTVKPDQSEVTLSLDVTGRRPGTYGIVVSRGWAADLRAGRPGPCTPLILLRIQSIVSKP